jgi:hypothetical protein
MLALLLLHDKARHVMFLLQTTLSKEDGMRKGLLVVLCAAVLFATLVPTMSHAWVRGGYHGWGPRHHYGSGWGVAGAAIGGVILGTAIGSALAPPVYVAPPPPPRVYYAYPPPPPRGYYSYPAPRGAYAYPY